MKFTVVGLGYVGMSLATLLSTKHTVYAVDILPEVVKKVNEKISPIADDYIEDFLKNKDLDIYATTNSSKAISASDYLIIATPTDYNEETNYFDTSSIESVIDDAIVANPDINIIIKSTIPFGYIDILRDRYQKENIAFSPEFLREGKALYDNLYPSRIIIGSKSSYAQKFADVLAELALNDPEIILMTNKEAEAVKLFSNTYLGMRVAFFNELDMFAEKNDLSSESIIQGVSADPRVGDYYNNPSFGYGGYCLPKDIKQLDADFNKASVTNPLISSISESNERRKQFIAQQIIDQNPEIVGVYKLAMKSGSDNYRSSSIFGVIDEIIKHNIEVIVYDEFIDESELPTFRFENNLSNFKNKTDIIITNRIDDNLKDVADKVYTRDIFREN